MRGRCIGPFNVTPTAFGRFPLCFPFAPKHLDPVPFCPNVGMLYVNNSAERPENLCVVELVHPATQTVLGRQVLLPNAQQSQPLAALGLRLAATLPEAKVAVGTRKKINQERKTPAK